MKRLQCGLRDLALCVFARYLRLMAHVQRCFLLEPAGSHGVWGLDDYHFLPYLLGAAQLVGHRYLRPKSVHNADSVAFYADRFLYFGAVRELIDSKQFSLQWHSPMLNDISALGDWRAVLRGLTKMYVAEVLGKLPIIQHFHFGVQFAFVGRHKRLADEGNAPHEFQCCSNAITLPSRYADATTQLPFD